MVTEPNADMVTKTWTALVKGDADTALANMSDEISWVIPGQMKPDKGGRAAQKPAGATLTADATDHCGRRQ